MIKTSVTRRPWLVVVSIALAFVVGAATTSVIGRGAPPASREMTFIDRESGYALALQVEPTARDAGAFVFRVPGVGLYSGRAGATMRVLSASSIVVHFDGPAVLGPHRSSEASGSVTTTRTVTVSLQAQVNPTQRTAEATLTDGATRYHLIARNVDKGGLQSTLRQFEDATVAADWVVLYQLMNKDVRAGYTLDSFAAQGNDQVAAIGRITALRQVAVSDVQTNDNGAMFVVVTYSADMRSPAGVTTTTHYDVFFIPELGSWRMWYSTAR